jgi:bis(5'-nucleosidyl)-tetraphosphatase
MNEKSVGGIIFRKDGEVKYLLLHYQFKTDYWDFPRGNVEDNESEEETARREITEETGLSTLSFVGGFREVVKWFYMHEDEKVYKEAVLFLAEVDTKEITLSKEHVGYVWLPYDKARQKLTFDNVRTALDKAHEFLGGLDVK